MFNGHFAIKYVHNCKALCSFPGKHKYHKTIEKMIGSDKELFQ